MSTLQVDRITPYQSASVQIDGDVTYTGAVSTGSFNAYTASTDADLSSLHSYTASQDLLNGTFATTGSNTFVGTQTFNNNIVQANAGLTSGDKLRVQNATPAIAVITNQEESGSAYASIYAKVDNTTDPANVYSAISLPDDVTGQAIGLAWNSYTGLYPASTPNIQALYSNQAGTDLAIAFPTTNTDSMDVWRKTNIKYTMNLAPQNPLPAGTVGDLAVSGSNLFFYNGSWTQVI
jgi:hypothetical protein